MTRAVLICVVSFVLGLVCAAWWADAQSRTDARSGDKALEFDPDVLTSVTITSNADGRVVAAVAGGDRRYRALVRDGSAVAACDATPSFAAALAELASLTLGKPLQGAPPKSAGVHLTFVGDDEGADLFLAAEDSGTLAMFVAGRWFRTDRSAVVFDRLAQPCNLSRARDAPEPG